MSDMWAAGMSGLLSPIDDKNVPNSLRQKIALAMLLKKQTAPKTLGEGLFSIGDSLSDAFGVRGIYGDAAAAEKVGTTAYEDVLRGGGSALPTPAPVRTSYAPETPDTPIVPATRAVTPPLMPARPLSPDEQQSDAPGAPVRMPSPEAVQDWRNSVPRPNIPPVPQAPPLTPPPQAAMPPPQPAAPPMPSPNFNDRFGAARPGQQSALTPPPGTPVMAEGNDPSAEERNAGRNMLTQAFQQRGAPPPVPPPQPAAPPPPPPAITPAPQPPQVRAVPPPPPPPEAGPGPGYVLKLPPEPVQPPTMTPVMQNIMEKIRTTPPAYRETVQQQLSPLYEQEKAKLAQENVIYQDKLKSRHELIKLQEEQRGKADADLRAARKSGQETITVPTQAPTDPRLLGTERSPQRTGPRIPPTPPGDIPERFVKQEAEKIAKTQDSYEKAKPELTETLDIIDKINKHPAKPYATGAFSGVTAMTPAGKGFVALNEQLMGKNLVDAYQKLQGSGQIGEKEGANFAKARARLTTAATEADYDDALKDLETTVRSTLERAQRNLKMPVTAYQKTPDDDYAPDIGEIGKRGGRMVEYIGGDPSKDSSYRTRTPR
jgi:hypothetical protein